MQSPLSRASAHLGHDEGEFWVDPAVLRRNDTSALVSQPRAIGDSVTVTVAVAATVAPYRNSPCLACTQSINEWTGERMLRDEDIPDDVAPEEINPLGNYAVQITWQVRGCSAHRFTGGARAAIDAECPYLATLWVTC